MKTLIVFLVCYGLLALAGIFISEYCNMDIPPIVWVIIASLIILLIEYLFMKSKINDIKDTAKNQENWRQEQDERLKKSKEGEIAWVQEQETIKGRIIKEIDDNLTDRQRFCGWLAPIMADIDTARLEEHILKNGGGIKINRPYHTQLKADEQNDINKNLLKDLNIIEYELKYIRTLIPGTEDIDDLVEAEHHTETKLEDKPDYLSDAEWKELSPAKKDQITLDRYKKREKKNWEIGRDFERYIGLKYEQDGYEVEYFGIQKKLEDLGRDLIAKKGDRTDIVQCKCWAKHKTIHEKHILQLYGTLTMYKLEMNNSFLQGNVRGVFVTSAKLSDVAMKFANALGIKVREEMEIKKLMEEIPLIKCNIGRDEFGGITKLYHLPIDQQYDKTKINKPGECYAFTVEEAIEKGFERRACRWYGNGSN